MITTTFTKTLAIRRGRSFIVSDYQSALLFHDGQFKSILEPGKYRFWKSGYQVKGYDLRQQQQILAGQDLLTADQVSLKLSAVVIYRHVDILKGHRAVENLEQALYLEAQLVLREIVAANVAETFLQNKSTFGPALLTAISESAARMGLVVERVDLRDVMLPADLKRSYISVLQQKQEAVASLEKARAETATLRALANAAKLMRENPEMLSLRYLEALQNIGANVGNTLVLGLTESDKLKTQIH